MKPLLAGLDTDDSILTVLLAAEGPFFPYRILEEFKVSGFESDSCNWRGLICSHLRNLEKSGDVERHQMGWQLTRKGKSR